MSWLGQRALDSFPDQNFRFAVGNRDQVGVTLVLHLHMLLEVFHQQSAGFAGDLRHGGNKFVVIRFGHGDVLIFAAFAEFQSAISAVHRLLGAVSKNLNRKDAKIPQSQRNRAYLRLALSSAMYMISCLKINRLGWSSRVSRTIFLS